MGMSQPEELFFSRSSDPLISPAPGNFPSTNARDGYGDPNVSSWAF